MPHLDAELERPEILADDRLVEIISECLRTWDAYPTIPGSRRWMRNGITALHELEARLDRRAPEEPRDESPRREGFR